MTLRGRVALAATLVLLVSVALSGVRASAEDAWLTQRCHSGSMRAEVIKKGYGLRLVGQVDCRRQVDGATFAIAQFNPDITEGLVDTNKLRPYRLTGPARFDLVGWVGTPGDHALCLVTSLRTRLSCVAFTAVGDDGPLRLVDVRQISPRDPSIRSRPIEIGLSADPVCNTCW